MKLKLFLFAILSLSISNTLISQNFKNALEYMDFISEEQELITRNMWKYTKAIAHSRSEKNIESKRNSLIKSVERVIKKIEKAKGFDGDDYKNKVLNNLRLNESLLKQDYEKIVDMKAVAEQSYDQMEAYILARELADKKMASAQQEYETQFYAYAKKHNIEIVENDSDLGKKMEISGKVFDHYNEMYLIFFKVNINEIYLWEAVEKSDVSAIQQNANALNETAKEGLEILKNVALYKNDKSLVEVTKEYFEYFIDETETKIPQIVNFFILNDEVESIKQTLEKTAEKDRTREQVNSYNKKVKEINKAINSYNKLNKELNRKRQTMVNKINKTNDAFLAKHIPND